MKSKIIGGFWEQHQLNVINNVIPYQWAALNDEVEGAEPSGCLNNFRVAAGQKQGEHMGRVFQDSDLAKFLEAAAYSLSIRPDSELEANVDSLIDTMGLAQEADGYLDTAFMLKDRDKRYTNMRDWHEMYVTGHFLEAAVAYKKVTGKGKLMDIMERNVDHTMSIVGLGDGKLPGYPGHEELELALCKAYELTGRDKFLDFAKYLIDQRGKDPFFFIDEAKKRNEDPGNVYDAFRRMNYFQAHQPVREQEKAVGHSVRAGYLYSGMADVAKLTGDEQLAAACERLFDNIADTQMYITGGVGQTHIGEAFTVDYDLPNDTVYAETCAAISMIFFAKRMLRLKQDGKFADMMERALYNGALSGISLDGTKYFYVNPLEVHPATVNGNTEYKHVKLERQPWFGCACCPPNIARLLASLQDYVYTYIDNTLYTDLYVSGETTINDTKIVQTTDYPNDGVIDIKITGSSIPLALRIPSWCEKFDISINNKSIKDKKVTAGYLLLGTVVNGDQIRLNLNIKPTLISCHEKVRANAGMLAMQYGPLVYCMEQVDNGEDLHQVIIDPMGRVKAEYKADLLGGITLLTAKGYRQSLPQKSLYSAYQSTQKAPIELKFVPYFAWANRGIGEMRVWVRGL